MSNKLTVFFIFITTLIVAGIGYWSFLRLGSSVPTIAEVNSTPIYRGYDFNLTKRCVRTVNPSFPSTFFEDTTECDPDEGNNWSIGIQAEKELGMTCAGANGQSLLVNGPNSPLSLSWIPHTDEFGQRNWQVDLTTDLLSKPHPCGAEVFTWYNLRSNNNATPNTLETSVQLKLDYESTTRETTALRSYIGWGTVYDGRIHEFEINFYVSDNLGDNHEAPDIITIVDNAEMEFLSMDGRPRGISLIPGETKTIYVKWSEIINDLISRGLMTAPSGGWDSINSLVYVGTELVNHTPSNSGKTTLSVSNFRNIGTEPNFVPFGWLGTVSSTGLASGWATEHNNQTPSVHFYLDKPADQGGTMIGSIPETSILRQDVFDFYRIGKYSGWEWQVPQQYLRDGQAHKLYAYAIDTTINGTTPHNTLLLGSGVDLPQLTTTRNPADIWGPNNAPDGVVDIFDLTPIFNHFLETGNPGWINADTSGETGLPDGKVNLYDYSLFVNNFGR